MSKKHPVSHSHPPTSTPVTAPEPVAAPPLWIGLMSGTSMDGIDGVVCEFGPDAGIGAPWGGVLAHAHHPLAPALRTELMALQQPGPDELHRCALTANALARAYAAVVQDLLHRTGLPAARIRAIGAHGQTLRHQPGLHDGVGYSIQILQPALLAELTGIDVISDLRSRDIAAGGQGAPLVPPFHRAVFGRTDHSVAVVNIGGISNLTLIGPTNAKHTILTGFDCGPGNALLDHWCQLHFDQPFDRDGDWAARGRVDTAWLHRLLQEPYFALPPPKSTGRDLFNPNWLAQQMPASPGSRPEDGQATLTELTARSICDSVRRHAPQNGEGGELLVCGGGALNRHLMHRLAGLLPSRQVRSTAEAGMPPDQVEATAFAWLARQRCLGNSGSLPSVTGARHPCVAGVWTSR
jgi:anhydro-N-acetylmuramic acid kinase